MKIHDIGTRLCFIGFLTMGMSGQTPINDSLVITFPNDVRVGSQLLKAGVYTIRQLSTNSNPRLLEFSTQKGTSIQASATAIAALDNNNRNDSKVILENRDGEQHIHRIWIKGKSYGYEFPIQENSSRKLEASSRTMRMTANYVPTVTAPVIVAESTRAAATPQASPNENIAANVPANTPGPPKAEIAEPQAVISQTAPQQAQELPQQVAQSNQPTSTSPQVSEPAPAPQSNNDATQRTPAIPDTALNWAIFLIAGVFLCGTALMVQTLRRTL